MRDHFVYMAEDAAGSLLYIGMTKNPRNRAAWHRARSDWFSDFTRARMIGPLPKDDAGELEKLLILKAGPKHNRLRCPPHLGAFASWGDVLMREVRRYKKDQAWIAHCQQAVDRERAQDRPRQSRRREGSVVNTRARRPWSRFATSILGVLIGALTFQTGKALVLGHTLVAVWLLFVLVIVLVVTAVWVTFEVLR